MDRAKEKGVSVLVDAEHSHFQTAINAITMDLMRKYNHHRPIVFNTYQTYLKVLNRDLNALYSINNMGNFSH